MARRRRQPRRLHPRRRRRQCGQSRRLHLRRRWRRLRRPRSRQISGSGSAAKPWDHTPLIRSGQCRQAASEADAGPVQSQPGSLPPLAGVPEGCFTRYGLLTYARRSCPSCWSCAGRAFSLAHRSPASWSGLHNQAPVRVPALGRRPGPSRPDLGRRAAADPDGSAPAQGTGCGSGPAAARGAGGYPALVRQPSRGTIHRYPGQDDAGKRQDYPRYDLLPARHVGSPARDHWRTDGRAIAMQASIEWFV